MNSWYFNEDLLIVEIINSHLTAFLVRCGIHYLVTLGAKPLLFQDQIQFASDANEMSEGVFLCQAIGSEKSTLLYLAKFTSF